MSAKDLKVALIQANKAFPRPSTYNAIIAGALVEILEHLEATTDREPGVSIPGPNVAPVRTFDDWPNAASPEWQ